jgi:hypothetical protein
MPRRQVRNDRFASLAVIQADSSPMTALGWKADTQAGRMFALTYTGRLEARTKPDLNGG